DGASATYLLSCRSRSHWSILNVARPRWSASPHLIALGSIKPGVATAASPAHAPQPALVPCAAGPAPVRPMGHSFGLALPRRALSAPVSGKASRARLLPLSIADGKRASSLGLTFIHRILAAMAQTPAPLDVVAQKLDAPHEDQRLVALAHAAAHGTAARSLSVKVAAMLQDESPAVQQLAGGIFPRIGSGATDAVPLLLALRAKGMPPALVARATLCLGCIGPSALAAIPSLKAALRQTPGDSDVLKALWQIAGDDPEVLDAVFAGAFASDFSRFLVASELIRNASDPVIDRAFAAIASRAQSPDPDDQQRAAKLLMTLAAKRPALASALV